jgi:hypothetical protein
MAFGGPALNDLGFWSIALATGVGSLVGGICAIVAGWFTTSMALEAQRREHLVSQYQPLVFAAHTAMSAANLTQKARRQLNNEVRDSEHGHEGVDYLLSRQDDFDWANNAIKNALPSAMLLKFESGENAHRVLDAYYDLTDRFRKLQLQHLNTEVFTVEKISVESVDELVDEIVAAHDQFIDQLAAHVSVLNATWWERRQRTPRRIKGFAVSKVSELWQRRLWSR